MCAGPLRAPSRYPAQLTRKDPPFRVRRVGCVGEPCLEMNFRSPKLWSALLGVTVCFMAVPAAQAGLGDALSDTTAAAGGALDAGTSALTQAAAPVTEAVAPVVETVVAPVTEVVAPVVQVVEEAAQPVVDAAEPVVDAAAPVVDLVESVVGAGEQAAPEAPNAPSGAPSAGSSAPGGANGPGAPSPGSGTGTTLPPSGPVGSPASALAPSTGVVLPASIDGPTASFGPAEDVAATALATSSPLADGGSSVFSEPRGDRSSRLELPIDVPSPVALSPNAVVGVGTGVVLLGLTLLGLLLLAAPRVLRRVELDERGPPRSAFSSLLERPG